ncbi:GAF and ANTAR domain-containing protein [Pseudonocardia ailaonensis]|uniref:GAF and ANTAR domain-containing protein n=1 Tax=Pseudonocardia ailaonensis TaxID=367279 RepID=A0ABN2MVT7_9PSEU
MTTEREWAQDRELFVAAGAEGGVDGDAGPLAKEFLVLSEQLFRAATVGEVLQLVVDAARAVVPGADMVSVTMRDPDGRFHTPVETDAMATRLDELQYRLDEGPCVAATRKEGLGLVHAPDLANSVDFPRYGPAAAEFGARGLLAVGLFPVSDTPRLGALNLYSLEAGSLDGADRDIALVLAAHASTALAATQSFAAAELQTAQLREALRSRDVIGQAKGILMERRGISAAEAFDVLRKTSQGLNVKLAQIAELIASRRADL